MHRIILLIIVSFLTVLSFAQGTANYNIYVQTIDNGKSQPAPYGTVVYFFDSKKEAENAVKYIRNNPNSDDVKYKEKLEVINGYAVNKIGIHKFCFASNFDSYDIWPIHEIDPSNTKFDLTLDISNKNSETLTEQKDADGNKNIVISEREVIAQRKKAKINKTKVARRGRTMIIDFDYPIDSRAANSKNRYVLAPTIFVITDTIAFTTEAMAKVPIDSVMQYSVPLVKDGLNYHETMFRRMGFNDANDGLGDYVDKKEFIENHGEGYHFSGQDTITNIEPKYRYPVRAERWYENYTSILFHDSVLVNDGTGQDDFKFMDFKVDGADINFEDYAFPPVAEAQNDSTPLMLTFQQGSAKLDENDSTNVEELYKVERKIISIKKNDGNIYGISVIGQASPEGGFEINDKLSKQRAATVADRFKSFAYVAPPSNRVAEWVDVAKLMEKDTIPHPEYKEIVLEIKEIANQKKTLKSQEDELKKKPYWQIIHDEYLPKLRRTDVLISYQETRIWSEDEIVDKYNRDKDWMPTELYQFSYLFKHLKDKPREIKKYAEEAMRIPRGNTRSGHPWPLAAYFYAKSLEEEGKCDTTILRHYIKLDANYPLNTREMVQGKPIGDMINDAAIVMEQIRMHAFNQRYDEASTWASTLFPNADTLNAVLYVLANGEPENEATQKMVEDTSEWNKIILYSSKGEAKYDSLAYHMLLNDSVFKLNKGRECYQVGVLAKRLFGTNYATQKTPYPEKIYKFNEDISHEITNESKHDRWLEEDFGGWMVKACELDPTLINVLRVDGEFSQPYRDGFAKFWNTLDRNSHRYLP